MSARVVPKACVGTVLQHVLVIASAVMLVAQTSAHASKELTQDLGHVAPRPKLAPVLRALVHQGARSFKAFVVSRKHQKIRYDKISAATLDKKGMDALAALEKKAFPKAPWDRERLHEYRDRVTVFKSGDRIVGYVLLVDPQKDNYQPLYGPPLGNTHESYLYVGHLGVDPDLKKNGLGSELVRNAFDRARQIGKKEVRLHVRATNGAKHFYKRRGFRKGGTQSEVYPNLLKQDGVMEDALGMWKSTSLVPSAHDVRQALHRLLALPRSLLEEGQGSPGAE